MKNWLELIVHHLRHELVPLTRVVQVVDEDSAVICLERTDGVDEWHTPTLAELLHLIVGSLVEQSVRLVASASVG